MSLCYKPFQNLFPFFESVDGIVPILNGIWIKKSPTLGLNVDLKGIGTGSAEGHLTLAWE